MFSRGKMSQSLKFSSLQISSNDCRIKYESFVLYLIVLVSLATFFYLKFDYTLLTSFFSTFGVVFRQDWLLMGVLERSLLPPVFVWKSMFKLIIKLLNLPPKFHTYYFQKQNQDQKQIPKYTLQNSLSYFYNNMDQQSQNNNERFIFPGQTINVNDRRYNPSNFYQSGQHLKSLYFGYLIEEVNNGHQYIDTIKKVTTYVPEVNQFVIGIIKNRLGESFIVDINAPHDGSLGALEFDGATKRNKPNLNPGDIVYTRVSEYSKFLGAKLSCLNSGYSVKNALGELKNGMIVYGLRGREKDLQVKLEIIAKHCQFEVAMGKNDILWFSCSNQNTEMVLYNIFNELLKGCSQELFQNLLKLLNK